MALHTTPSSSWIKAVAYDSASCVMVFETVDGNVYSYNNFSRHRARRFAKAASPGKWYNRNIKGRGIMCDAKMKVA